MINNYTGPQYDVILSPRLGYSANKEQYGFFYRSKLIKVVNSWLATDIRDEMSREPFSVLFELVGTSEKFFIVPIHTVPVNATEEIEVLPRVFDETAAKFGTSKGVIMGDFNADCDYVSNTRQRTLKLRTNATFHWLVADDWKTTVSLTSDCAYDRVVVSSTLFPMIKINSTFVYNYTTVFGLTNDESLNVSDHYPVVFDVLLPSSPSPHVAKLPVWAMVVIVVVSVAVLVGMLITLYFFWKRSFPSSFSLSSSSTMRESLIEPAVQQ
jgi:endonuclease/exonuclease/phosphatase family metal-dependent hydrolase